MGSPCFTPWPARVRRSPCWPGQRACRVEGRSRPARDASLSAAGINASPMWKGCSMTARSAACSTALSACLSAPSARGREHGTASPMRAGNFSRRAVFFFAGNSARADVVWPAVPQRRTHPHPRSKNPRPIKSAFPHAMRASGMAGWFGVGLRLPFSRLLGNTLLRSCSPSGDQLFQLGKMIAGNACDVCQPDRSLRLPRFPGGVLMPA